MQEGAHQRFINLMRQSHVMPFVPLPNSGDPAVEDTLFAVLQPVDSIAQSTLASFEGAHEGRKAWEESLADAPVVADHGDGVDLVPQDPRAAAQPGTSAGLVCLSSSCGFVRLQGHVCPPSVSVSAPHTSARVQTDTQALTWENADTSKEEERVTGFLVHVVCLASIMKWYVACATN